MPQMEMTALVGAGAGAGAADAEQSSSLNAFYIGCITTSN